MPHNIWKAAIRKGEYMGASANGVWRITPVITRGARGATRRTSWYAVNMHTSASRGPYTMNAKTLKELGAKLARI